MKCSLCEKEQGNGGVQQEDGRLFCLLCDSRYHWFSSVNSGTTTPHHPEFPIGSEVLHAQFGRGKVLYSWDYKPAEKTFVKFNDKSRMLLVPMAKLEKVQKLHSVVEKKEVQATSNNTWVIFVLWGVFALFAMSGGCQGGGSSGGWDDGPYDNVIGR